MKSTEQVVREGLKAGIEEWREHWEETVFNRPEYTELELGTLENMLTNSVISRLSGFVSREEIENEMKEVFEEIAKLDKRKLLMKLHKDKVIGFGDYHVSIRALNKNDKTREIKIIEAVMKNIQDLKSKFMPEPSKGDYQKPVNPAPSDKLPLESSGTKDDCEKRERSLYITGKEAGMQEERLKHLDSIPISKVEEIANKILIEDGICKGIFEFDFDGTTYGVKDVKVMSQKIEDFKSAIRKEAVK